MRGYLAKRLLQAAPTILGSILLVYGIARALPGDPITVMFGELEPPPEVREELEKHLGLDQPFIIQYFIYLRRIISGDWGKSIFTAEPVLEFTLRRFQATFELTILSIAIASAVGLAVGFASAMRRDTPTDKVLRLASTAGFSMPVFWWGLLLILLFSVQLGLLPPMGRGGFQHLVLPALTLATFISGMIARLTRASMLEVLTQDHVTTARAKGLSETVVWTKHVLRNALIPIATFVGLQFGTLLGGAAITETVFAYPGVGKMVVDAIFTRDYPVIVGGLLFVVIVILITNLIVDMIYAFIDPRVRYERAGSYA